MNKKKDNVKDEQGSFFEMLFRNNQEIMLLINPDTLKIVDCNHAACSFYGLTYQEMITLKISHFNCIKEGLLKKEVTCAKNSKKNQFYFKHRLANGEIRDVEVHSSPVTVNDQDYLLSIIRDNSEIESDNALLKKENKLLEKRVSERTYELEELNSQLVTAKDDLERELVFIDALFESIPVIFTFMMRRGDLLNGIRNTKR